MGQGQRGGFGEQADLAPGLAVSLHSHGNLAQSPKFSVLWFAHV